MESTPPMALNLYQHTLTKFQHKLLEKELLSNKELQECLKIHWETGKTLDQVIRESGYCSEIDLIHVLAECFQIPFWARLEDMEVPEVFIQKVPIHLARSYCVVAIGQEGNTFQVATCTPFEIHKLDEIANLLQGDVEPVLSPKIEIFNLINQRYPQSVDRIDQLIGELDEEGETPELDEEHVDVMELHNQPRIVKIVNWIFFDAVRMRASDIHLQPTERDVQVRYRVDGVLRNVDTIPKAMQEAVISRIKVMGKMDIAEKRLPQDGRTTIMRGDTKIDIRISSVPTSHGERLVMRILVINQANEKLYQDFNQLGLSKEHEKLLSHLITRPNGIIFVTGPTGSGKTTTLYSILNRLNSKEKNIITIEDPIEYHLPGISQIQVSTKKGLTFAAGLKSLLRQDPDIMMVGEVRDEETARIAIQSALTGHLVFSTLHTNDSAGAITRMLDIGIEPYLVASSVIAVVAQRLVRRICENCRGEYVPSEEELEALQISVEQLPHGVLWKGMGKGCAQCWGTGYFERTAIYEILEVDHSIRELITQRASAAKIKEHAIQEKGLKTLRMDGIAKIFDRLTTIEEVVKVTAMDIR